MTATGASTGFSSNSLPGFNSSQTANNQDNNSSEIKTSSENYTIYNDGYIYELSSFNCCGNIVREENNILRVKNDSDYSNIKFNINNYKELESIINKLRTNYSTYKFFIISVESQKYGRKSVYSSVTYTGKECILANEAFYDPDNRSFYSNNILCIFRPDYADSNGIYISCFDRDDNALVYNYVLYFNNTAMKDTTKISNLSSENSNIYYFPAVSNNSDNNDPDNNYASGFVKDTSSDGASYTCSFSNTFQRFDMFLAGSANVDLKYSTINKPITFKLSARNASENFYNDNPTMYSGLIMSSKGVNFIPIEIKMNNGKVSSIGDDKSVVGNKINFDITKTAVDFLFTPTSQNSSLNLSLSYSGSSGLALFTYSYGISNAYNNDLIHDGIEFVNYGISKSNEKFEFKRNIKFSNLNYSKVNARIFGADIKNQSSRNIEGIFNESTDITLSDKTHTYTTYIENNNKYVIQLYSPDKYINNINGENFYTNFSTYLIEGTKSTNLISKTSFLENISAESLINITDEQGNDIYELKLGAKYKLNIKEFDFEVESGKDDYYAVQIIPNNCAIISNGISCLYLNFEYKKDEGILNLLEDTKTIIPYAPNSSLFVGILYNDYLVSPICSCRLSDFIKPKPEIPEASIYIENIEYKAKLVNPYLTFEPNRMFGITIYRNENKEYNYYKRENNEYTKIDSSDIKLDVDIYVEGTKCEISKTNFTDNLGSQVSYLSMQCVIPKLNEGEKSQILVSFKSYYSKNTSSKKISEIDILSLFNNSNNNDSNGSDEGENGGETGGETGGGNQGGTTTPGQTTTPETPVINWVDITETLSILNIDDIVFIECIPLDKTPEIITETIMEKVNDMVMENNIKKFKNKIKCANVYIRGINNMIILNEDDFYFLKNRLDKFTQFIESCEFNYNIDIKEVNDSFMKYSINVNYIKLIEKLPYDDDKDTHITEFKGYKVYLSEINRVLTLGEDDYNNLLIKINNIK